MYFYNAKSLDGRSNIFTFLLKLLLRFTLQVAEKFYYIMLYTSPWSRFELTTSVVIVVNPVAIRSWPRRPLLPYWCCMLGYIACIYMCVCFLLSCSPLTLIVSSVEDIMYNYNIILQTTFHFLSRCKYKSSNKRK